MLLAKSSEGVHTEIEEVGSKFFAVKHRLFTDVKASLPMLAIL